MAVAMMSAATLSFGASAAQPPSPESHEHGLPEAAGVVFHVGGLPVTNSMLMSWVVALGLILFAQAATRRMKDVPEGAQNFWEWMVESLYDFLEGIIGRALVKKTFWFLATVFIFILFSNWFGLAPVIGNIGWGHATEHGFHVETPLFRGINADLNMTFALSLLFFALWLYWAVSTNGVGGFLLHIFGPQGDSTGALKLIMILVFFIIGFLESFSILFRPISLSFRLYGNIFAGENMLEAMSTLVPRLGWMLPIPFYFMELLVGFVQALVFMLLAAVFTLLICQHDEGHEKGHEKAPH